MQHLQCVIYYHVMDGISGVRIVYIGLSVQHFQCQTCGAMNTMYSLDYNISLNH